MNPAALQRIALDVAAARSVPQVLAQVVSGVAAEPGVAMARIWMIGPGDQCDTCLLADECTWRERCLHLAASAGASRVDPARDWQALDGRFRRFPMGVRKVGRIASTGEPLLLSVEHDDGWLVDPEWARDEGLRCFAGQPLKFRDEVIGVLAVFARSDIDAQAFDWLRTFADHAAVAVANARAFEEVQHLREQLELERDYLRAELVDARAFAGIVGDSPAVRAMLTHIERVAPTDATVLVVGESGTGKELVASAIHEHSARAARPLVRVNCAAVPRDLFESEFFGHVRGAFTGATSDRKGRFQVADGGTLFLDEVGEIPLELQGKLLRVLQEGQFSPVGSDRAVSVDVRLVAATNRDLSQAVAEGSFREDLYYRLSVFPVNVPPLRARMQDVPALAMHFLRQLTSRRAAPSPVLRRRDVAALTAYHWPGNVRELQNVIERAVILASSDRLHFDLADSASARAHQGEVPGKTQALGNNGGRSDAPSRDFLTEDERVARLRADIRAALHAADGKLSGPGGAAELLGLRPSTLSSRMRALGMKRPR
ncbi:MAG: hydrogenase-4 transcriptional activator [Planctomycetota bacterium]|nr:MAG: hydrogenase-4 transcriptional activator [Planctomycetota bacterium]